MGFGKAKYDKGPQFKRFRLETNKDGSATYATYRIFPPMKKFEQSGEWRFYSGAHFGYKVRDKQDPSKEVFRTFRCIENKNLKTGMILKHCPECDKTSEIDEELKAAVEEFKKEKKTEDEIKALTKPLRDYVKSHNCDRKWKLAAMNEKEEIGILEISHKCMKQLEEKIKELRKDGVDPLDVDDGVWFLFKRTGFKVQDITDTVDIAKEKVKVENRWLEDIKRGPVSQEKQEEALKILPDLDDTIAILTEEQIQALVDSEGNPEEVDVIFNAAYNAKREASATPDAGAKTATKPVTKPPVKAAPKADPKPEVKTPAPAAGKLTKAEELRRQLAEAEAAEAAEREAAAAAPAEEPAASEEEAPAESGLPDDVDPDSLNDADFLSKFPDPARM